MTDTHKILAVDDEPEICEIVSHVLGEARFDVETLNSGERVMEVVAAKKVDLVVLDLGLPGIDGLTLTRSLKEHSRVGVVILSGRGETTEKVIGLEIGADDYVAKPFEPRELLARVRSVLRRLESPQPNTGADTGAYVFEGWRLDVMVRTLASPAGDLVSLSSGEFNLLRAFVEHPNRVLSRDQLLDFTRSNDTPAFDRSVDVQIVRLRKKIETDAQNPEFIKTVRNAGYIFAAKVSAG